MIDHASKATPVEVRSAEGKLLFRASSDGRLVEVVDRRRRYVVALDQAAAQPVIVVCAVIEDENPIQT